MINEIQKKSAIKLYSYRFMSHNGIDYLSVRVSSRADYESIKKMDLSIREVPLIILSDEIDNANPNIDKVLQNYQYKVQFLGYPTVIPAIEVFWFFQTRGKIVSIFSLGDGS